MFSVVIPLYNKQDSVYNTIQSVLIQTFDQFEIVVIDDGSTDDSVQVVRQLTDKRIRLIQKENGGVCSARNRGIMESRYDYIAFLDGDDIWDESYLAEQYRLIQDFSDAAMWGINFAHIDNGNMESLETGLPNDFRGYVINYFANKCVSDLFCSSSVVVRKSAFERTGLFDERIKYGEDLDMWYRIILNFRVVFDARLLVFYRQDADNRALGRYCALKYYLPYYVDKYDKYKKNEVFYRFIQMRSAVLIKKYYFEVPKEHADAIVAVRKLDYSVLPVKYKYLFKTPYFVGVLIYKITNFKQAIFKIVGN